jgi:ubiquinone/menaquinone biosynthesis C-methylase UbiE
MRASKAWRVAWKFTTGYAEDAVWRWQTFDAIVASNSIHNIYDREGRKAGDWEIVRVLKSGGQVALLDIRHTAEYAEDLKSGGDEGCGAVGLGVLDFSAGESCDGVQKSVRRRPLNELHRVVESGGNPFEVR